MPESASLSTIGDATRFIKITYPGSGNNSQFVPDPYGTIAKIQEYSGGALINTRQFVWSGDSICESRDASSSVSARYFEYGQTIGSTAYFYTKDSLNSVREMVDTSANIQAEYGYDPFGRISLFLGSLSSDFRYAGYYFHAPSGLSLTLKRAYSSSQGRWISRDPLEEEGGVNLYSYVFNDPIHFIDPWGLQQTPPGLDNNNDGLDQQHPERPNTPCVTLTKMEVQNAGQVGQVTTYTWKENPTCDKNTRCEITHTDAKLIPKPVVELKATQQVLPGVKVPQHKEEIHGQLLPKAEVKGKLMAQ